MKKITLKNTDIQLEIAQKGKKLCSFCGENDKECVTGSYPLVVKIPTFKDLGARNLGETKYAYVCDDYETYFTFFGDRKIVVKGNLDRAQVIRCSEYKHVYERVFGAEPETVTDTADICKDCVQQLAEIWK